MNKIFSNENKLSLSTKVKKRAKRGIAVGLSVGLLLAGAFAMIDQPTPADVQDPAPIVQMIDDVPAIAQTSDDDADKKQDYRAYPVRGALSIVFGAVASLIVSIGELIWGALLAPVVTHLLLWLLIALGAVGALAIGLKAAFPDIPLRELLTKKRIGGVILGVMAVCALCAGLPIVWSGYGRFRAAIRVTGIVIMMAVTYYVIFIRPGKKAKARAE